MSDDREVLERLKGSLEGTSEAFAELMRTDTETLRDLIDKTYAEEAEYGMRIPGFEPRHARAIEAYFSRSVVGSEVDEDREEALALLRGALLDAKHDLRTADGSDL
jgi:hypothetical protein